MTMTKDLTTITEELSKPFQFEDIEWRISNTFDDRDPNGRVIGIKGKVVPYLTNRAIQDRLDKVFGIDGWYNEYKPWIDNTQLCGITCRFGDTWITKWDGSDSGGNIEVTKSGLSNSMKRASVQWSIGRYMYKFGNCFVKCEEVGAKKTKVIAKGENGKLEQFYYSECEKIFQSKKPAQRNQSNQSNSYSKQVEKNQPTQFNNNQNARSNVQQPQNNFNRQNPSQQLSSNENAFNSNFSNMNSRSNSTVSNSVDRILESLIKAVRDSAALRGVSESKICEAYGINSLDELDHDGAKDALKRLTSSKSA